LLTGDEFSTDVLFVSVLLGAPAAVAVVRTKSSKSLGLYFIRLDPNNN